MTSLVDGYYSELRYVAVIEDPDGFTYNQPYEDFDDLKVLRETLGDDYWIVDIYSII